VTAVAAPFVRPTIATKRSELRLKAGGLCTVVRIEYKEEPEEINGLPEVACCVDNEHGQLVVRIDGQDAFERV
jgi:hypothetical protein